MSFEKIREQSEKGNNDSLSDQLLNKNLQQSKSLLNYDEQFVPEKAYLDSEHEQSEEYLFAPTEKKFVVITGQGQGGFDLDEIFQFGNQQSLQVPQRGQQKRLTIAKRISRIFGDKQIDIDEGGQFLYDKIPSYFAFYMLAQAVFIGAIQAPWVQSIGAEKILRIAWRFLMQTLILIPLVLYEYRTGSDKVRQAYNLKYILQRDHIRKLYISSLNTSITVTVSLVCQQWTYVIHAILLTSMTNFWLSVGRRINKDKLHFVESIGDVACVIGVIVISFDVYLMNPNDLPSSIHTDFSNDRVFLTVDWQRIIVGHGFPIICSYVMTQLAKVTADIKNIYPPFLSMFIISTFCCLNLMISSYFVDGTDLNLNNYWGWFGFIKDGSFTHFMYMSIIINFGMLVSQIFISKLFEPIVPALSSLSEPILCMFLLHIFGLQYMPGPVSFIGYMLILPGQFVIILGQYLLSQEKEFREKLIVEQQPHLQSNISPPLKVQRQSLIQGDRQKQLRVSFIDKK